MKFVILIFLIFEKVEGTFQCYKCDSPASSLNKTDRCWDQAKLINDDDKCTAQAKCHVTRFEGKNQQGQTIYNITRQCKDAHSTDLYNGHLHYSGKVQ